MSKEVTFPDGIENADTGWIIAAEVRANPPLPTAYTHGTFVDRETGEQFALAIHEPDSYFRTHSLRNKIHFVQCTESEFRVRFSKV